MDGNSLLKSMVRIGKVSSADWGSHTIRVIFPDYGNMVSGPLYVLQRNGENVTVSVSDMHSHTAATGVFMPAVGAKVLCLYVPVPDGDGFVLGVI